MAFGGKGEVRRLEASEGRKVIHRKIGGADVQYLQVCPAP